MPDATTTDLILHAIEIITFADDHRYDQMNEPPALRLRPVQLLEGAHSILLDNDEAGRFTDDQHHLALLIARGALSESGGHFGLAEKLLRRLAGT